MPVVPQYGSSPRVDEGPTQVQPQRASATAGLLGTGARQLGQMGDALSRAGDIGGKIAVDIQTRHNTDVTLRSLTATQDDSMGYQNTARERLGANADGLTKESEEWWDAAVTKHGDALENDAQRRAYMQQVTPLRQSSMNMLSAHEGVQRRKSLTDSTSANSVSAINMATASPYDREVQTNSRAALERNVNLAASLNGWTDDQRTLALGESLTKMHQGVIGAMVDKDPRSAKAYYDAYQGEIDGTLRAGIEKTLEIGGIRERTQKFAADIIAKSASQDEALRMAQAELTGVEEDDTVTRINQHYSQKRGALEGAQKDALGEAWQYAEKGGLDAVPSAVLSRMDGRDVLLMQDYFRARANQNEADIVTVYTNAQGTGYTDLMTMAATNPEAFAKLDPNKWRLTNNTQDWNALRAVHTQAVQLQGKPIYKLMTANSIADSFINQAGLTGPQNKANAAYVKAEMINALAALQAAQPDPTKPLSDAQMMVEADRVYKGMVDRKDPRLGVNAPPAVAAAKAADQQRAIALASKRVLQIRGENKEGRNLTANQSMFSTAATKWLRNAETQNGAPLTHQQVDAQLAFLLREGSIETEYGDDLDDVEGYFFEFLSRKDIRKFKPDEK